MVVKAPAGWGIMVIATQIEAATLTVIVELPASAHSANRG